MLELILSLATNNPGLISLVIIFIAAIVILFLILTFILLSKAIDNGFDFFQFLFFIRISKSKPPPQVSSPPSSSQPPREDKEETTIIPFNDVKDKP